MGIFPRVDLILTYLDICILIWPGHTSSCVELREAELVKFDSLFLVLSHLYSDFPIKCCIEVWICKNKNKTTKYNSTLTSLLPFFSERKWDLYCSAKWLLKKPKINLQAPDCEVRYSLLWVTVFFELLFSLFLEVLIQAGSLSYCLLPCRMF